MNSRIPKKKKNKPNRVETYPAKTSESPHRNGQDDRQYHHRSSGIRNDWGQHTYASSGQSPQNRAHRTSTNDSVNGASGWQSAPYHNQNGFGATYGGSRASRADVPHGGPPLGWTQSYPHHHGPPASVIPTSAWDPPPNSRQLSHGQPPFGQHPRGESSHYAPRPHHWQRAPHGQPPNHWQQASHGPPPFGQPPPPPPYHGRPPPPPAALFAAVPRPPGAAAAVAPGRRPLLILDLNHLLCDRLDRREAVRDPPHAQIGNANVYVRPHVAPFLRFLLERFTVAVWTSARHNNAAPLVGFLFGDLERHLYFFWTQQECTKTFVKGMHKPLFLKELSRVWNSFQEFSPSNTVLLDDSPEKCKRNPEFTAIHPAPWYHSEYTREKDLKKYETKKNQKKKKTQGAQEDNQYCRNLGPADSENTPSQQSASSGRELTTLSGQQQRQENEMEEVEGTAQYCPAGEKSTASQRHPISGSLQPPMLRVPSSWSELDEGEDNSKGQRSGGEAEKSPGSTASMVDDICPGGQLWEYLHRLSLDPGGDVRAFMRASPYVARPWRLTAAAGGSAGGGEGERGQGSDDEEKEEEGRGSDKGGARLPGAGSG